MLPRYYIYLGFIAFFAFSLGLNIGLLGFHSFHFEQMEDRRGPPGGVERGKEEGKVLEVLEKGKRVMRIERRNSAEVPGDKISAVELQVKRDISGLVMPKRLNINDMSSSSTALSSSSLVIDSSRKGENNSPQLGVDVSGGDISSSSKINPFSAMGNGPIAKYLQEGGEIPIVLITCNRVDLLEQTIQNLLKVRGITKDIIVMQDGTMESIANTAKAHGLELVQNKESSRQLRGYDGASRIATHYKFALTTIFNMRRKAPAAIIIEDDLLFSPDFYEYFLYTAPIVEQDKTVFAVSAWNDNGFKGRVQDPYALRRTEFFPGLGWLLSRELYKNELEKKWPKTHWDHWLRAPETHKGREIVYPEVPRTYHNGIKGTFMNMDTHNQYFRDIAYNQDASIDWGKKSAEGPVYNSVFLPKYEERIVDMIQHCHHVKDVQDIVNHRASVYCIWIRENPDPQYGTPPFQPISKVFGIWHEHKRGVHKGMHEFYWSPSKNNEKSKLSYFLILNTMGGDKSYEILKPSTVPLLTPKHFKALLPHLRGG